MKLKPSKNFLVATGLLVLSFAVMQGIVVPSIVKQELTAQALKSRNSASAVKNITTIQGTLVDSAFEEFDENGHIFNEIHNFSIQKDDGTAYQLPSNEDFEQYINQRISYNPQTQNIQTLPQSSSSRNVQARPGPGYRDGRAAVFLVKFADPSPQSVLDSIGLDPTYLSIPPQDIGNQLFDRNQGQFQKFFSEMTHGQVTYTGNVFGWYTMPGSGSDAEYQGTLGGCTIRPYSSSSLTASDQQAFETKLQAMIDYYGVDMSQYNTITILTQCDAYGNIGGYASSNTVLFNGNQYYYAEIKGHPTRFAFAGPSSYTNFPQYVGVLMHEIGHTFGLLHSNALNCDDKTIWSGCSNVEYGNPFSKMGYTWSGGIYDWVKQRQAGWLSAYQILQIDSPGSYYIDNLQTQGGTVGAYVNYPGSDLRLFALEHRSAEGFDSYLQNSAFDDVRNGLLLYARAKSLFDSPFFGTYIFQSGDTPMRIVDSHPTSDGMPDDIQHDAITANNPFEDPLTGVSINVTNVTPDGIYFDVDYDLQPQYCNYDIPTEQVITSVNIVNDDLIFNYGYLPNTNLDVPCEPKIYEIIPQNNATSLALGDNNSTITVKPGMGNTSILLIGNGVYSLSFSLKDLQTDEQNSYHLTNSVTGNAPSNLQIPGTGAPTSFDIIWEDNSGGINEDYFVLQISQYANFTNPIQYNVPADTTSYNVTIPQLGLYYLRIKAVYPQGYSDWSNIVSTLTPAPSNLQVNSDIYGQLHFTWEDNSVDLNESSFSLQRREEINNGFSYGNYNLPTDTDSYILSSLKSNTEYTFQIISRYYNGQYLSPSSNSITIITDANAAPTNLQVIDNSPTNLNLIWQDNSDNIGVNENNFYLVVSTGSNFANPIHYTIPADTTSYIIVPALLPNTTYYLKMRADYPQGNYSNWSNVVSVTTVGLPAPSDLQITGNLPSSIDFSWQDNSDDEDEVSFVLQVAQDTDFTNPLQNITIAADTTDCSIAPPLYFLPNTTYYFRLRAAYSGGVSSWSNTVSITTGP